MQKFRVILALAALVILFALGLWLGWGGRRWASGGGPAAYNTATGLRQVQTLSQSVTVKYVLEKVVVMEDVKWFGESRVLLIANGVVKVGVDFSCRQPRTCGWPIRKLCCACRRHRSRIRTNSQAERFWKVPAGVRTAMLTF